MASSQSNSKQYTTLETPQKNRILRAVQILQSKGIKYTKKELSQEFGVTRNQIDYTLAKGPGRTQKRSQLKAKNNEKLTERDLDRVEEFIKNNGPEGHHINWAELLDQFGFNIDWKTLRDRMAPRSIFTFVPSQKPHIGEKLAKKRVNWAKTMLQRYPTKFDWRRVRFSDEVHFGWGPEGRILIIRHRGNGWRNHPDCIQRLETRDKKNEEDQSKRVHFWGAIGYNFKSPLIEYTVPSNTNGKMTQEVYVNQILNEEVIKWTKEPVEWVLEEDNDSGHGAKGLNNKVNQWKRAHGMSQSKDNLHKWYFNCPRSPDLAIIEDGWSYPKQYVKKRPHWNDEVVVELGKEGWDLMPQEFINKLVDSMPQRLQDVIDSGGQLVNQR